jgi:hypothetical protein
VLIVSWNPDSGDALTSPPITVSEVEKTSNRIWAEWLAGWFDGTTHQLRGVEVQLPSIPVANITFQEMQIAKPMDGLYLQVTLDDSARAKRRFYGGGQWNVLHDVCLHFYFRAFVKAPRADGHNSLSLVRWGSDTLYAILTSNNHCTVLNWLGMMQFRPKPPRLVGGISNPMRAVSLDVRYVYSADENLTSPVVSTSQAGRTVYIGRDQEVRVTPAGLEVMGEDGVWYLIGAVPALPGEVPTVKVTEQV